MHTEFSNFLARIDLLKNTFKSMEQIAKFSEEQKSKFPLPNLSYWLLLTIPVTVAKDEHAFSRLKIVKTPLHLSYEKYITESIEIDVIAKDWETLKLGESNLFSLTL